MDIPWYEDHWEMGEDGKEVWTPYMLQFSVPPGYPGPERFGHWPGVFEGGKQIGPAPIYGWVHGQHPSEREDEP